MKKLISVLIAVSMLLASMLIMASCNDNGGEPTVTEKPSASDSESSPTENEEQSTSDTPSNLDHSHSFGEWSAVKQPTCTESGLQERACSCGEKEQSVISALNHTEVPYDTVNATNYATGFQGGTYCSNCQKRLTSPEIIPSLNTLKLPSQNATTVTEEQWKNAFDLTKLESFTMIYQTRSIEACYDAEDESEETEENFLGYITQNEVNATVKYNNGNIFVSASQYRSYSENTVTDEALGTIEFQEQNKFREVDWFCNSLDVSVQPAEILDDSIYDLEGYGYSLAVYSEETRSYTIEVKLNDTTALNIEACFENGFLVGYRCTYAAEYESMESTLIFSDINENLPIQ